MSNTPTRHVRLDFSNELLAKKTNALVEDLLLGDTPSSESLVVKVNGFASLLILANFEAMIKTHNGGIEELHWMLNIPIPKSLLEILAQGHSKLFYTIPFAMYDPYNSTPGTNEGQILRRHASGRDVLSSPNLYSLTARIIYSGEENYKDLQLVQDIMATCQNMRHLDLSLSHFGCVVASSAWMMDFEGDARPFPPLESLRVCGYDFRTMKNRHGLRRLVVDMKGPQKRDFLYLPWSLLPGWFTEEMILGRTVFNPLFENVNRFDERMYRSACARWKEQECFFEPDNLNAWIERMDMTKLHTLQLDEATGKMLQRLSPVLTGLKHFALLRGDRFLTDELPSFFGKLASSLNTVRLRNLHFRSEEVRHSMLSALAAHEVKGLEAGFFQIGDYDSQCVRINRRDDLSEDEMTSFQKYLRHVEMFDFNIFQEHPQEGTSWDLGRVIGQIEHAAMFPALRKLNARIWSSRRCDEEYAPHISGHTDLRLSPFGEEGTYRDLFEKINSRRSDEGLEPLCCVEVHLPLQWIKNDMYPGFWVVNGGGVVYEAENE